MRVYVPDGTDARDDVESGKCGCTSARTGDVPRTGNEGDVRTGCGVVQRGRAEEVVREEQDSYFADCHALVRSQRLCRFSALRRLFLLFCFSGTGFENIIFSENVIQHDDCAHYRIFGIKRRKAQVFDKDDDGGVIKYAGCAAGGKIGAGFGNVFSSIEPTAFEYEKFISGVSVEFRADYGY